MRQIRTMLDLSTAHLPRRLCDSLSGQSGVVAYGMACGWLMWVPDDPDASSEVMRDRVPDVVLAIQRHARSLGCDWVLFDRDADVDEQLVTWNW